MTTDRSIVRKNYPSADVLEERLLSHPNADIGGKRLTKLKHHFAPGVYIRELWRPQGTLIVGHAHKTEHLNILTHGHLRVYMGGKVQDLLAPSTFLSKPGVRKITYAMEDSTLMTIHATQETDPDKLEQEMIDKSSAFLMHEASDAKIAMDRADYLLVVPELGMTHERVQQLRQMNDDLIPLPKEFIDTIEVRPSRIEGVGVFALRTFTQGSLICPTRLGLRRTPAGRYTNHSIMPNGEMRWINGGDIQLFALQNINVGDEITVNYRTSKIAADAALKEFQK